MTNQAGVILLSSNIINLRIIHIGRTGITGTVGDEWRCSDVSCNPYIQLSFPFWSVNAVWGRVFVCTILPERPPFADLES